MESIVQLRPARALPSGCLAEEAGLRQLRGDGSWERCGDSSERRARLGGPRGACGAWEGGGERRKQRPMSLCPLCARSCRLKRSARGYGPLLLFEISRTVPRCVTQGETSSAAGGRSLTDEREGDDLTRDQSLLGYALEGCRADWASQDDPCKSANKLLVGRKAPIPITSLLEPLQAAALPTAPPSRACCGLLRRVIRGGEPCPARMTRIARRKGTKATGRTGAAKTMTAKPHAACLTALCFPARMRRSTMTPANIAFTSASSGIRSPHPPLLPTPPTRPPAHPPTHPPTHHHQAIPHHSPKC